MFFKLIILTLTINSISCYFENCDQSYFLPAWTSFKIYNSGGTIGPVATSGKYMPGSSCRFTIKTSLDFAIKVVCNIKIDMPTKDCGSSRFQISRDGLYSLAGSEYFCPTNVQTVIRQSIDNTLVFGHTSGNGLST